MSSTASYKVGVNVAHSNNYVFTNTIAGDLVFNNYTSNTGVYFGANSNLLMSVKTSNSIARLDVQGDVNFTGTLRQGGAPYIGSQWSNTASNIFVIGSNIGIGTSNPSSPLEVAGTIKTSNLDFSGQLFRNGTPYVGSQFSNTASNVFLLSSNLGIGTSNPSTALEVVGTIKTSNLDFSGQILQNGIAYIGSQWSNTSSNVFIIGSNIGIGTSNPATALAVIGDITIASNIIPTQASKQSIGTASLSLSNTWTDRISAGSTLAVIAPTTTISGDVTIGGNVTVNGSNFVANVQTVEVKDNIMLLNKGETGAGVTAGTAGLSIDRGTTSNPYQILYQESTQTLRIGLSNTLETAATREWAAPTSNTAFWSSNTASWSSNNLLNKAGGFISGPLYENPADSSNAPSYSFSNDTNTGMFHAAQGTLGFAVSGSNLLSLSNSLISLNTNVTLPGPVNFGGLLVNRRTGTGPTNISIQPQFSNNGSNVFLLSGSNLGIGTASPSTALEVAGTITASAPGLDSLVLQGGNNFTSFTLSNSRGNAQFGLAYTAGNYSTNAGSNDFVLRTPGKILLQSGATAAALCINSNNFIGIGTSTPTSQLQVTGTVTSSNIYTNSNTTSNAPSYSFTGDTNTGMFNNSNGVIGFTCKGSNIVNMSSSNVDVNGILTNNAANIPLGFRVFVVTGNGTTSSNATWTVPAGVYYVKITGTAGGGGGGGVGNDNTRIGAGGGGAGSTQIWRGTVTPGQTFTVFVGGGGSGGSYNTYSNGSSGSSTLVYIGATYYIAATGGSGGYTPTNNSGTAGGPGGTLGSSLAQVGIIGGDGGAGMYNGGGGGYGGISIWGGGGYAGMAGGAGTDLTQNGASGKPWGSGGGGGRYVAAGGNGAPGIVIIEY